LWRFKPGGWWQEGQGERMEFETFVIIVAVVLIFVMVTIVGSNRRNAARLGQRVCQSCGAAHPPFAQYCRRCGQKLKT
jgi:hypothetical protein